MARPPFRPGRPTPQPPPGNPEGGAGRPCSPPGFPGGAGGGLPPPLLAGLAALLAAACAGPAEPPEQPEAADSPPPAGRPAVAAGPVPDAPPRPLPPGAAPGPGYGSYLAHRYGLSEAEGRRRQENEAHVSRLAESLHRDPLPGFSSLWIEHEPAYGIFVAFKGAPDRAALLARAHPALHPDIVLRPAKRDRAEIERDQDRLVAAFRATPGPWSGGYDVKTGKFAFDFAGPPGLAFARRAVPGDLRDDTILRIGPVPVPLAR